MIPRYEEVSTSSSRHFECTVASFVRSLRCMALDPGDQDAGLGRGCSQGVRGI
jgi:hypothetical protein